MPNRDATPPASPRLWYDRPAREILTEGLPIGNGKLAALIAGDPARDRLALNEGTLWSAGPYDANNPAALEALPEVRRLVFAGEYRAAAAVAESKMMGNPKWQPAYQPMANLWLEFPGHMSYGSYRRELDLDRASVIVEYESGGVRFVREAFVSAPDDVLVVRIRALGPSKLECLLRLDSEQRPIPDWAKRLEPWHGATALGIRGRNHPELGIEGALTFALTVEVRQRGGRCMPGEGLLSVRDADEILLVAAAATSYRNYQDPSGDPDAIVASRLAHVRTLSFDDLLARHLADYQPLFRRLHIEFDTAPAISAQPTDARVAQFEAGEDAALAALYVQYARYLLIACSRAESQPANLQGLWNDKRHPPWGSKCTININTEMNYWPALPAALPECMEPLFRLLEDLVESGRKTARLHYGARGWVAHHNVDLWRATAPVDGAEWGLWPMGGAWLSLHLWERYRFSPSAEHLRRAYPIMKGACEFFVDFLVRDPRSGHWVTCPSLSPENQHPYGTAVCAGPTMDAAILRDLFHATAEAATSLGVDEAFRQHVLALASELPPYRVGREGQLQEWQEDWDLDVPEPQHRHVSHLFGVYPSHQISPRATPELAAAARKSLELRGDAATGWSLAWKVNLWARLLDGERAYTLLKALLSPERTYTNLFDAHPPFQIDGNFGGAAGILEMLVQSEPGRLHLLPALPNAWPRGQLRGVKARGALTVQLVWANHTLSEATITSLVDQKLCLRIRDEEPVQLVLTSGVPTVIRG